AEWARRLVDAGFDSLWTPEIIARGPLVPDPFVLLAAAAAVTGGTSGTVELGTATVQVPLHHPVELAHRVHSLLAVCGDRLSLGVSPGSTRTDHVALGRDFARRFAVLHGDLARLRVLLADGRDEQVVVAPAPRRRPPLLLGSWGANVERAAHGFDGWLASGVRRTPDEIVEALGRYRAAGGRRAVVCAVPVDAATDLGRLRADLQRYADAGFDDAVVLIAPGGPEPTRVRALCP
ncbi:MAG: LLM class flavin-dependent oxidoreductase, partial [Jatrophihabitans sp.]|uniref:LLM class flavin-dependent oxidoreductase n=1 Tax=Jatrophihabitans sp. TaxID=1932789 RepID=UPI003F81AB80